MRYHLTPVRMAIIKKSTNKNAAEGVWGCLGIERQTCFFVVMGSQVCVCPDLSSYMLWRPTPYCVLVFCKTDMMLGGWIAVISWTKIW